ncbi:hypothetical protein CVT25_007082 [Psilocybe cyanescens]|uniref:Cytochrome P450 n=1 Tax=Psilocybe cyanescens TaxID=93625 RepID=A0A409WVM5_PSICY|nr:hypothetical protein CVT25_007082 [Psilocybe cyanescens]
MLWLADADAIKEIISSRTRFPKPTELYKVLRVLGPNIIAADAEDWKKFRRICSPAFSERNSRHVWETTFETVLSILDAYPNADDYIVVDNASELTLPIALSVLATAGLGQSKDYFKIIDKTSSGTRPHKLSFRQALEVVAHDLWIKIGLSSWMYILHPRFRKLRHAFNELEVYLREMIEDCRNNRNVEQKADLFNLLLEANSESTMDGSVSLTDEELLGNLFTFVLGGHEGTAYTLCFALAALAVYSEEQELVFKEVQRVLGSSDGQFPGYEDMASLRYTMAVINETLRMFPPVNVIPKYSAADTILPTRNKEGAIELIPVPQGTRVVIHTTGLHYNRSRSCLGRKFFETESVAALALIVSRYKITVKEEPQFSKETFEERKARIFKCRNILTLTPDRVPLVFTRRQSD